MMSPEPKLGLSYPPPALLSREIIQLCNIFIVQNVAGQDVDSRPILPGITSLTDPNCSSRTTFIKLMMGPLSSAHTRGSTYNFNGAIPATTWIALNPGITRADP